MTDAERCGAALNLTTDDLTEPLYLMCTKPPHKVGAHAWHQEPDGDHVHVTVVWWAVR